MNLGQGAAWLAAVCVVVPLPAKAALWAADPSMEMSLGANDNYGLAVDRTNRVGTLSMTGGMLASRQTESMVTSLNANVVGLALRGDIRQNELQDSFTLRHTLSGPIDAFAFSASVARDDTLQTPTSSADLLIGRGLQRSFAATASWTRNLTERLSATSTLGLQRTRYSRALVGARDYQNGSGAVSLQYLLDERDNVNASVGHQDYRTLDNAVRSLTDDLDVGFGRALSETGSISASLGRYRTRLSAPEAVLVCPDDPSLCAGGLVAPVTIVQAGHHARWGVQYSGAWSGQVSETTKFALNATRQEDPSGAGVTVRSDTVKASLDRAFSETLSGTVAYTRSGSAYQGLANGPQSTLQTVGVVLAKALAPRLTLRANVDYKRSDQPLAGPGAHSASFAITLRYEWQRLEAHH